MTAPSPSQLPRSSDRPHMGAWAWLSALAVGVLFLAVNIQKIWSVDIWTLLRMGQWFVEQKQFPRAEVFSYTSRGHEWIELRWLFCLFVYWGRQIGGWSLLILAKSAAVALAFGLMARPLRATLRDPRALAVLGLGIYAGASRWVVRPELGTYLFSAVFLVVLEVHARDGARRGIWWLAALQALWVNSHTVFIMGPVIVGAFLAGELLCAGLGWNRRADTARANRWNSPLRLAFLLIAVCTACLVNPYLARGALFPLKLFGEIGGDHVYSKAITEFRSPFMTPLADWPTERWAAVALILAAMATFIVNIRRMDFSRLLILAAGIYLALSAVRNIGLLAIFATWAGLANLRDLRDVTANTTAGSRRMTLPPVAGPLLHGALAVVALLASWDMVTGRYAERVGAPREFGLGVLEREFPVGAVDFLLREGARPSIFHALREGGYVMWAAGERMPVYADGRLEVYPEPFLTELFTLRPQHWPGQLERWKFNTILLNGDDPGWLFGMIRADANWALVYFDHRNAVFVRRIPEHADLIAKGKVDPSAPWAPPAVDPCAPPPGWLRAFGAVDSAWYAVGLCDMYLRFDQLANATAVAEWGRRAHPGNVRLGINLAGLYRALGRTAEAQAIERTVPHGELNRPEVLAGFAGLMTRTGRHMDAAALYRRAIEGAGEDAPAAWRLAKAEAYVAMNDAGGAVMAYREAQRARPKSLSADDWQNYGIMCERVLDAEGAISAFRECVRLDGRRLDVLVRLGELYLQAGQTEVARRCFEAVLKQDPNHEAARRDLQQLGDGGVPR